MGDMYFRDIFWTTSAVLSLPMYGAKASAPNKTLKKTSRRDATVTGGMCLRRFKGDIIES